MITDSSDDDWNKNKAKKQLHGSEFPSSPQSIPVCQYTQPYDSMVSLRIRLTVNCMSVVTDIIYNLSDAELENEHSYHGL